MGTRPQLSVITDEISQDFDHALAIANQYGITDVEVRGIWKKNIALLSDTEIQQMQDILTKYQMRVAVISSPFAKCVLPGSRFEKKNSTSLSRDPSYNLALFDRILAISDKFDAKIIRIFNFFKMGTGKIENPIEETVEILRPYMEKAHKKGKILILENEHVTFADDIPNTLKFLDLMNSPACKLNLDPGNFYSKNERVDPDAYAIFYQKNYVAHMHVKDPLFRLPFIGSIFDIVGKGKINYQALFKQAIDNNFTGYFTLETHAAKNKEQKSIESLIYLKKLIDSL